jgi:uncharacterized protein YdhG (YjbR/CyaY superfamily)
VIEMAKASSVEEYLDALPNDRRAAMDGLRATIRAAAPEATESIAYDMPAFRIGGEFLVSYAAYKRHYSLFPASAAVIEALGDELTPFLSGAATIQFPASSPIPFELVRKVVETRLAEKAALREP